MSLLFPLLTSAESALSHLLYSLGPQPTSRQGICQPGPRWFGLVKLSPVSWTKFFCQQCSRIIWMPAIVFVKERLWQRKGEILRSWLSQNGIMHYILLHSPIITCCRKTVPFDIVTFVWDRAIYILLCWLVSLFKVSCHTHTLKGFKASAAIVLQWLHLNAHKKPGYWEQLV